MRNIFLLLLGFILILACRVNKPDYIIYCIKGDPSSIRIIPKKDPFKPISDSLISVKSLTVANLKAFQVSGSGTNVEMLKEKIQDLDNKTFTKLTVLQSYYYGFRSRPCDEKSYTDYIENLNAVTIQLLEIKTLSSDINKVINGGGLSGTSTLMLVDLLSAYLLKE